MKTYISILRGINVSGHHLIKMEALRKSYEGLGFHHVKSYVQSGNVIFSANEIGIADLEQQIVQRIQQDFGFEVPVIILSIDKLKQIIENNPFLKQPDKELAFFHITFLSSKPEQYDFSSIEEKRQTGEEIVISDTAVYLYCPNGYGNTKLNNTFIEKKLNVRATTRNWKTSNELLRMAQQTI